MTGLVRACVRACLPAEKSRIRPGMGRMRLFRRAHPFSLCDADAFSLLVLGDTPPQRHVHEGPEEKEHQAEHAKARARVLQEGILLALHHDAHFFLFGAHGGGAAHILEFAAERKC